MKVTLTTGDPYDFLRLEAQTLQEASDLVFVNTSSFVRDKDRLTLLTVNGTVELQIRLSSVTKHVSAEVNEAHDREP
jgi:hypothetical protein